MYPVQSQKWWRSLQKNRVVGGWQFVTRRFGFIVEAVSAVDITRQVEDFNLQELKRLGHGLHWLTDCMQNYATRNQRI